MSERRYHEDEVREIFGLAARGVQARPSPQPNPQGLTLAEMQSIGLEVGLEPDVVAHAARALDARPNRPLRTSLGMPIEVARVVDLARAPTDREWEQLVTELRATFRARGRISAIGNLREWSNGNLHAAIEPTDAGYRLRLGTLKGDARGINALGASGLVAAGAVAASLAFAGELAQGLGVPLLFGGAGIAAFLSNMIRLPRWARRRAHQMDHIAARIRSIMSEG